MFPTTELLDESSNYSRANFISKQFCWWIFPLLRLAHKKGLQEEDIYAVPGSHSANVLGDLLATHWEKQRHTQQPNLDTAVYNAFGFEYIKIVLLVAIRDVICRVGQAPCLVLMLKYLAGSISREYSFLGGGILICLVFLSTLLSQLIYFKAYLLAMKVRVALSTIIYTKALRLPIGSSSTGEIATYISIDLTRLEKFSFFLVQLLVAPVQALVIIGLLCAYIGPAALVGCAVCICVTPIQLLLGKLFKQIRIKCAESTDVRARITSEIITGIKSIKMFAWEDHFTKILNQERTKELKQLLMRYQVTQSGFTISEVMMKFSQFLIVLFYVITRHGLDAEQIFVMTTLMTYLGSTLATNFLASVIGYSECKASSFRIQQFLLLGEKQERNEFVPTMESNGVVVDLRHVSLAKKFGDKPILSGVNMKIAKNQFVGVIGGVGSGKTSLFQAMLREIPIVAGSADICTRLAYVSQDPWIFPGTLKENILFGKTYNDTWFNKVLDACALRQDIKLMPDGEMTFLGDRGITLSGGQQARLNLARAVYADADLYLLDDPLSAVDFDVAKIIMSKCIRGLLSSKAILLATHSVHNLEYASQIFVLKNGTTEAQSYTDVLKTTNVELDITADHFDVRMGSAYTIQEDQTPVKDNSTKYGTITISKILEAKEQQSIGRVKQSLHWKYLSAAGVGRVCFLVLLLAIAQVFGTGSDYWLKIWTQAESLSTTAKSSEAKQILIYLGIIVVFSITAIWRSIYMCIVANEASRIFHKDIIKSLLHAPMRFFEVNNPGRVLNRVINDMGLIDDFALYFYMSTFRVFLGYFYVSALVSLVLPINIINWLSHFQPLFTAIGVVISIGILIPQSLIITLLLAMALYKIRNFYLAGATDIKRIESIARSPVFGIFNSTASGLPTIRASRSEKSLYRQFLKLQDMHSSACFCYIGASRWFLLCVEWITTTYVIIMLLYCMFMVNPGGPSIATAGFIISSAITLVVNMSAASENSVDLENTIICVDRILGYSNIEPESNLRKLGNIQHAFWPSRGKLDIKDATIRYGSDPPILHSINLLVSPKQKVGIVGRTGAGKSSLLSSLLRLVELYSGSIHLDNIDISKIPLHDLRRKISIIPQNPVLFYGTVRTNLDPFVEHTDSELWQVLRDVKLDDRLQKSASGLHLKVTDAEGNFSHGERQLLCFARALLDDTQILVLDEATAFVDSKTDTLIKNTIREKFGEKTIITVAHRLSSVIDNDRVVVLDNGKIMEDDHPYTLLQNPNGYLYKLCEKAGPNLNASFRSIAEKSYLKNMGT